MCLSNQVINAIGEISAKPDEVLGQHVFWAAVCIGRYDTAVSCQNNGTKLWIHRTFPAFSISVEFLYNFASWLSLPTSDSRFSVDA